MRAADPQPSARLGKPSPGATRDLQLTVEARRALARDPDLGPLNVGVNVRDGVATLWGPIPSDKLAARAIERVKTISALDRVRNELSVEPVLDLVAGTPSALPPAVFAPVEDAALRGRKPAGELLPRTLEHTPLPLRPSSDTRAVERNSEASSGAGAALLPPVVGERPTASPAQETGAKLLPPRAEPSLGKVIDRLRRSDDRYKHIEARIDGGIVTLSGAAYRQADMDDLANAVSQLPGVERVILEKARTAPNLWNDASLRDLRIGGK